MIRLVRVVGVVLAVAGALVCALYAVPALRAIWPWLLELPWPLRLGLGLAGLGLLILVASLLWERFEDRKTDRELLDEP